MGAGRTALRAKNFNKNWQRVERGGSENFGHFERGGWYLGGGCLRKGGVWPPLETMLTGQVQVKTDIAILDIFGLFVLFWG